MDKTTLYYKLDIENPDEFKYFENLSALLEEDDFIEENLIKDLLKEIDRTVLLEHMESYFEDFLKNIPEDESEFYIIVDGIGRVLSGLVRESIDSNDINNLAEELHKFRKWYVHDLNVFDKLSGQEINVRDARFNIVAAGYLDEVYSYDFRLACEYELDGYDVMISDFVEDEYDETDYEGFSEINLEEEENFDKNIYS